MPALRDLLVCSLHASSARRTCVCARAAWEGEPDRRADRVDRRQQDQDETTAGWPHFGEFM